MVTLILFVLIFGVVVISHEFGHFLLAKANGIHVIEFSVGMGPNLFSFQKGDTKYSLKLLPIGGACMFEGEDGLNEKEDGEDHSGSFLNANVWARISTVLAGPVFNFILGFIIAFIMVNLIVIRDPVATEIVDGGAAQEAGLQPGDRILSLNGSKIHLYEEIQLFTLTYRGGNVTVQYERDGVKGTTTLTPKYDESAGRYMIGISNADFVQLSGLDCFRYSWYEMRYCVTMTWKSLAMLVQGQVSRQDVAGPVGIAVTSWENLRKYKRLRLAECTGEYVEYHPDAYGESGDPESPADSCIGRRQTGIPDLGSHYAQTGAPGKRGHGTLHRTRVFYGADGVPVI